MLKPIIIAGPRILMPRRHETSQFRLTELPDLLEELELQVIGI
jgi:hypothetical protein